MIKNILITFFIFYWGTSIAQVSWQKTPGPNESVTSITVNSVNTVYAGTVSNGIFKSTDNGTSWANISLGLGDSSINDVQVASDDKLFASTATHGIYQYSAGSWTSVNTGLPSANVLVIHFVKAPNGNMYMMASTGKIYYWNGAIWTDITFNFPANGRAIAGGPNGNIYAGAFAGGVYKFDGDNGNNWNDMNPGLDARRAVLCFTNTKAGSMFVGTHIGPWRSVDNGNTWQLKNTNITHLTTLQILSNAAGDILCQGHNNVPKGAIYRSTNNGESWTQVAANGCDLYTKIKQHKSDTIWASSRFSGATTLSYSINNGASWVNNPLTISAIWDIDFSKDNTIFIGSESEGVSRSDNGGQTFTLGVGNSIPWYGNVIEIETDANGFIFAGGDWWTHILWFSTPADNGNVWTQFTDPDLTISGAQDLIFDQNNNAYLADESNGIRMAYNTAWSATTNWIPSSAGLPTPANTIQLGFDNYGFMYAAVYTNKGHNAGLYKSTIAVNSPTLTTYTFTGNGNWDVPANW
ncbi:MAG: hypothetical protein HY305_01185, partial [Sphingobacteriales bacterium]|nr:hypothetical protein [Sphingobacteriales bacterium]